MTAEQPLEEGGAPKAEDRLPRRGSLLSSGMKANVR